jgi:hypothetical protein
MNLKRNAITSKPLDLAILLFHIVVYDSVKILLFDTVILRKSERTSPNDSTTVSNGEAFFSSDLHQPKTLKNFWESFKSPTVVKIARIVNGSVQGNKPKSGKIGTMGKVSNQSASSPVESSKRTSET